MKWTEGNIGSALARQTFSGCLCAVPNCIWTGEECDLLVVTRDLRLIDVEVKISRADLKADKLKAKWWHTPQYVRSPASGKWEQPPKIAKPYPCSVWKHYYAMPEEIWRDDLLEHVQPVSGVLLLSAPERRYGPPVVRVRCVKRAKPNRDAKVISAAQAVDIARLASLRMWDALKVREPECAAGSDTVRRFQEGE